VSAATEDLRDRTPAGQPPEAIGKRRLHHHDWPTPILGAITLLAFTVMYAPLVLIALFSVGKTTIASFPLRGFTTQWYSELFSDPDARTAAITTGIVAVGALVLSSALGVPTAFAAYRRDFRGKTLLSRLLYMPVVLPGLVNGFVLLNWITLVNLPLGIYAVIALHGAVMAAIVFSLTYARLIRLDPSMEEAAHDLGASRRQTLRWVLLPSLRLTLIGALLLVFMLSLEDLLGIFFLIGSGFNIQMLVWSRLRVQLTPELHAMATVIFVLSILVVVTYSFLLERDSKQSS
jgi:spermidine/putrescine transport system permease protein